jgi:hypothetical protein
MPRSVPQSVPPFLTPPFGAIAFSRSTGRWGSSWGFHSTWEAEDRALSGCGIRDCSIIMSASDCWVALAMNRNNGYWGVASGHSQNAAEERAVQECARAQGSPGNITVLTSYHTITGP